MAAPIEVGAVISDLENEYQRSRKFLADLCRTLNRGPTHSNASDPADGELLIETQDVGNNSTNIDCTSSSKHGNGEGRGAHLGCPDPQSRAIALHERHAPLQSPRLSDSPPAAHTDIHNLTGSRKSLDVKSSIVRFDAPEAPASSKGLAARVSRRLINIFHRSPSSTLSGEAHTSNEAAPQGSPAGTETSLPGRGPPAHVCPAPALVPPALAQFMPTVSHTPTVGHHRRSSLELVPASAAAHRRKSLDVVLLGHSSQASPPGNALSGLDNAARRSSLEVSASGSSIQSAVVAARPRASNLGSRAGPRRASIASYSLPPVGAQSQPQQQQEQQHSAPLQALPLHLQPHQQLRQHSARSLRQQLEAHNQQQQHQQQHQQQQHPHQLAEALTVSPAPLVTGAWAESGVAAAARAMHSSLDMACQSVGSASSLKAAAEHLPRLARGSIGGLSAGISSGGGGQHGPVGRRRSTSSSGENLSVSASASPAPGPQSSNSAEPLRTPTGRFSSRVALMAQQAPPLALAPSGGDGGCVLSPGSRDGSRRIRSSATGEPLDRLPPKSPCGASVAAGGAGTSALLSPRGDPADGSPGNSTAASGEYASSSCVASPAPSAPLPPLTWRRASGTGEVRQPHAAKSCPGAEESDAAGAVQAGRVQQAQAGGQAASWAQSSLFAAAVIKPL